jgi:hypothetical protein
MNSTAIDLTLGAIRPDRQLHYENYQVVSAVQALLGAITPNMVAVSLECIGPAVHLHFYLEHASSTDGEEIEDVASELEALQCTGVPISTHVSIVGSSLQHKSIAGRPVYRRHEREAGA